MLVAAHVKMRIYCDFESEKHFNSETYACKVTSASIYEPKTAVDKFIGEHMSGKSNDDVEVLMFIGAISVEYLPVGVEEIFPNLKILAVMFCDLCEVLTEDVIGLKNLEHLIMVDTRLAKMPDDLFDSMPKLRIIDFWYNNPENMGGKIQNFHPNCEENSGDETSGGLKIVENHAFSYTPDHTLKISEESSVKTPCRVKLRFIKSTFPLSGSLMEEKS